MKTMTVGEFKARFSEALDAVRAGKTIVVSHGRNHRKIAVIVPYEAIAPKRQRPLGLLSGKAKVKFSKDFALFDDDLLSA